MEKFINDLGAFLEQHVDFKKVGGLYHWRIGRLGGSVYLKKAKRVTKIVTPYKREIVRAEPVAMPATIISQDRINLAMRR